MLTLFFTIIFIAEVIIAAQIIQLIMRADRAVVKISSKVEEIHPEITKTIYTARLGINKALLGIYNIAEIIEKQKAKYKKSIIKNSLTTILFFMLSKNGKQVLTAIDLLFTAKEFLDRANSRKSKS